MVDKRKSRGPAPKDREFFGPDQINMLRNGVGDLSWLLTRGYALPSALKLVGDRYCLRQRQRTAVMRASCGDPALAQRQTKRKDWSDLAGRDVVIDGYNLLITVESALSGGVILKCRDGCYRDLAAIHGTYRKIEQTLPGLELICGVLKNAGVGGVQVLYDQPVSNSGRLKVLTQELFEQKRLNWAARVCMNPDREMIASDRVVISSDSAVLDQCQAWANAAEQIFKEIEEPWIVDLSL